jgi:RHS repeat-associated protein
MKRHLNNGSNALRGSGRGTVDRRMSGRPFIVAFASLVMTILSGLSAGPVTFSVAALWPMSAHASSTAVGTVAGKFGVNSNGGASYTIPLDLPPGIAGLAPSLSIQYSSATPYTYMGAGFSIGGLSQISRCPKTIADDGVGQGVTGAADDFCLDGQKLVPDGDGTYRTQIDSYQQITLNGSVTNPTSFTVKSKSGLTMTYGVASAGGASAGAVYTGANTASANQSAANYVWLIGEVEDSTGNYMLFKYTLNQESIYSETDDTSYLIKEIDYSGNAAAGVSPFVAINFNYEANTSVVSVAADRNGFLGGAYFHWDDLLTSITANVSGQGTVRTWNIGYSTDPARLGTAIVSSIQECGSDGSCLPVTALGYVDTSVATAQSSSISLGVSLDSSYNLFPADLDNDGHADLLAMKWTSGNTAYVSVMDDPGKGNLATAPVAWSLPSGTTSAAAVVGDFNRDGISDAAFAVVAGCDLYIVYALGTGNGTLGSPTTVEVGNAGYNSQCPSSTLPTSIADVTEAHYGDFAGAGYGGMLLVDNAGGCSSGVCAYIYQYQVVQFGANGFVAQSAITYGSNGVSTLAESFTTMAADVNGDGISDLIFIKNRSLSTDPPTDNNYAAVVCLGAIAQNCVDQGDITQLETGALANFAWSAALVDMNGDGTPDLVMFTEGPESNGYYAFKAYIFLSDGLGHIITGSSQGVVTVSVYGALNPVFGDFDGDGITDIGFYSTGSTTLGTSIVQNNGDGYNGNYNQGAGIAATLSGFSSSISTAVAADIHGYGHNDIVALAPGSSSQLGDNALYKASTIPLNAPGLLASVVDGYGAQTVVNWSHLTDYTSYSPANDANTSAFPYSHAQGDTSLWSFPNRILHQPIFLVSSQTTWQSVGASCGQGGVCPPNRSVAYTYSGARANVQGRGFLGFAETQASDSATAMAEVTDIRQDFPYTGMTSHTLEETSSNVVQEESIASSLVMTNTCTSDGQTYDLTSSTTTDAHHEVTASGDPVVSSSTTTNSFNCYGELGSNQVTTYVGTSGSSYVTASSNTYGADNVSAWLLGRMDSTTVTRTNADGTNDTRYSTFGYDPNTGLLTMEKIWGRSASDTTHWTETDYYRDGLGNIQTTTVSGPDITSRPTGDTFPTTAPYFGRFSTKTCNPLQQCLQRTYDAAGDLLTTKDANGILTTYYPDGFGRSTGNQTTASGLTLSATITRNLCSAATNGQCSSSVGLPGTPYFYVETTKNDGSDAVTVYDSWERSLRSAAVNGAGVWTETLTQYDNASRPIETSSPHFASASSTFWKVTNYDAVGRPQLITGPVDQNHPTVNLVKYTYGVDATTNFASVLVTDGRGKNVTQLYDPLGRLSQTTDNDSHVVSLGYDPFDNLTSITGPSGKIGMGYDSRGHKTSMSDPTMGSWIYTPDSLGELRSRKDANLNTVSTTYDQLGRPLTRSAPDYSYTWTWDQSVDGTKTWYGALFDVNKTQSGGGMVYDRNYTYTTFGGTYTSQETIDGTSYTTSYGYDGLGRANATDYPNGLALTIGYSNYGPENSISQQGTGGQTFWSAKTWDQWGKISQEDLGNGVVNNIYRDGAVGTVNQIVATPPSGANNGNVIANLSYAWDADYNIAQRTNNANGQSETLAYDNENRLGSDTVGTPSPPAATITVGNYDPVGNPPSRNGPQGSFYGSRTYTWTKENQLAQVNDGFLGEASFQYGESSNLVNLTTTPGGSPAITTQYIGGGLAEYSASAAGSSWSDYITAPTGTVAMVVQSSSQADVVEYLQTDNQGSVTATTDGEGNLVQQYAYDPYGRRNVTYTAQGYSGIQTDLGYTGHRQIDLLNLVHMRGRVYDPSLSRFLSADPNIRAPSNAQSLNRYAYVENNPLTFTDPSGYVLNGFTHWLADHYSLLFSIAITAAFSDGAFGLDGEYAALAGGFASGLVAGNGSLKSGLIGADFGLLNYGVGETFGEVNESGVMSGSQAGPYVGKIVFHGVLGGMQAGFSGQRFGSGFLAGAAQAAGAPFIRGSEPLKVAEAAAIGGTASVIGGGKFDNGAITAAFAQAYNDSIHLNSHSYDFLVHICDSGAPGCTAANVFEGLLQHDYPGQPDGTEVRDGGVYGVYGNLSQAPIIVTVDADDLIAINTTRAEHIFCCGTVTQSVVPDSMNASGGYAIAVVGGGNNTNVVYAALNWAAGRLVFLPNMEAIRSYVADVGKQSNPTAPAHP